MRRFWSAVVTLVSLAALATSPALAGVEIEASLGDVLGKTTLIRLTVVNVGDDNAIEMAPLVAFRNQELEPEGIELLVPGARYTWELEFPLADAAGAFPVTAWIRYRDGYGEHFSVPVVHLVGTPGYGAEVSLALTTTPVVEVARVTATLANPTDAAVAGRLVVLLPDKLGIEPKSQPVEVPAGGETAVPLVIQNLDAAEGSSYPIQALFEYDQHNIHHTALGLVMAPVEATEGESVRPVMVGALAMMAALAALLFAWRRAARKRDRLSRAERRRADGADE